MIMPEQGEHPRGDTTAEPLHDSCRINRFQESLVDHLGSFLTFLLTIIT